jgi:hypothetical protein
MQMISGEGSHDYIFEPARKQEIFYILNKCIYCYQTLFGIRTTAGYVSSNFHTCLLTKRVAGDRHQLH